MECDRGERATGSSGVHVLHSSSSEATTTEECVPLHHNGQHADRALTSTTSFSSSVSYSLSDSEPVYEITELQMPPSESEEQEEEEKEEEEEDETLLESCVSVVERDRSTSGGVSDTGADGTTSGNHEREVSTGDVCHGESYLCCQCR